MKYSLDNLNNIHSLMDSIMELLFTFLITELSLKSIHLSKEGVPFAIISLNISNTSV